MAGDRAQAERKSIHMKVVYVGPTIPGVATRNATYSEVPESITAAATSAPYLPSLCVPISGLADALKQIAQKRGAIYIFYKQALSFRA